MMSDDAGMFPKPPSWREREAEAKALFEEKYKRPFSDLTSHYDKYGSFLDTLSWYYYTKDDEKYVYDPNKSVWYDPSEWKDRLARMLANRT
jgi:hypothetical protein